MIETLAGACPLVGCFEAGLADIATGRGVCQNDPIGLWVYDIERVGERIYRGFEEFEF